MPKERLLRTSDDWLRFFRERKRAENAITNGEFFRFVLFWCVLMLMAHCNGRF